MDHHIGTDSIQTQTGITNSQADQHGLCSIDNIPVEGFVISRRSKRRLLSKKSSNENNLNTSNGLLDLKDLKTCPTQQKKFTCERLEKLTNTSTPKTTAKRFSGFMKDLQEKLSPVNPQDYFEHAISINKLGNPLLSSTKLHREFDNDRLMNADRLYKHRLGKNLDATEADLVKSQLLHMNAHVDTLTWASEEENLDVITVHGHLALLPTKLSTPTTNPTSVEKAKRGCRRNDQREPGANNFNLNRGNCYQNIKTPVKLYQGNTDTIKKIATASRRIPRTPAGKFPLSGQVKNLNTN